VDPEFVCPKTIREEGQIISPYPSFRPSFLPSSHTETLDLCEILNGGATGGWGRFDENMSTS